MKLKEIELIFQTALKFCMVLQEKWKTPIEIPALSKSY